MLKVMLIDDESAIRNLLKIAIKWEELGMSIVGEASSGIEAIHLIDELQPDIAFVDIRMPFMDGIEFSKVAIKRYPRLKIIILTAMNDFEYARQCIGIGICEYMLKPIVRGDITQALMKIRDDLMIQSLSEPMEEELLVDSSTNETSVKIQDYLKQHYADADLNLTAVAQAFNFNASYLSRMFKAETGRSLIDFLTEWRMEKAISLASLGTPMYLTATQVGIPDPNYFGKCFRKYTGQSYSSYGKN